MPAKTTAKPSPLETTLAGLVATSAQLRADTETQMKRVSRIEELNAEKTRINEDVFQEKLDFSKGSKRLAEIAADLELLEFTSAKRAEALVSNYHQLRDDALQFKKSVIAAITSAEGTVMANRQAEVAGLMKSWGASTSVPAEPLKLADLAVSCPTLAALEGHRSTVYAVLPDAGLSALVEAAKPALEALEGFEITPAKERRYGGFDPQSLCVIKGWDGQANELKTVAEFKEYGPAREYLHSFGGKSGWLNIAQLILFGQSHAEGNLDFNEGAYSLDYRANSAAGVERGHTGADERFFAEVASYTA